MMVMKKDINNGLYILQEITVTDDVGVSRLDLDKTMLQHLNLGHMREKCLKELSI